MQVFESVVDGKEVVLLYEGDWEPCCLYIRLIGPDIVTCEREYRNAKMLSADLACDLLYGNACDFLHEHGVPYESALWDLNHSGPPGRG